jgi:hypothetical protein
MNPEYILYLLNPNYRAPSSNTAEGFEELVTDRIALEELTKIIQANLELIDDELGRSVEAGKSIQYGDYKITHSKPRSSFDKTSFEKKYPASKYPDLYEQKTVLNSVTVLRKQIPAEAYNEFLKTSNKSGSISIKPV